jgi:hypothetical protein
MFKGHGSLLCATEKIAFSIDHILQAIFLGKSLWEDHHGLDHWYAPYRKEHFIFLPKYFIQSKNI